VTRIVGDNNIPRFSKKDESSVINKPLKLSILNSKTKFNHFTQSKNTVVYPEINKSLSVTRHADPSPVYNKIGGKKISQSSLMIAKSINSNRSILSGHTEGKLNEVSRS